MSQMDEAQSALQRAYAESFDHTGTWGELFDSLAVLRHRWPTARVQMSRSGDIRLLVGGNLVAVVSLFDGSITEVPAVAQ